MCVNGRLGQVMQVLCGFDPDHGHPDMIAPVIADFLWLATAPERMQV